MSTLDVVAYAGEEFGGVKPANYLDIGGGASAQVMANGLDIVLNDPEVNSVFVNVFGGITACDAVANGIVQAIAMLEAKGEKVTKPLVCRIDGNNAAEGRRILDESGLAVVERVETMDDAVKEEFAYIYLKFEILGILNYSAIHCDLHCGNVFFYINECVNDYTPKYQMGIIDFGLTCFPNKLNQNAYYIFLNEVLINKDYSQLFTVLHNVIEEKERFNAMPQLTKEALKKEICDTIELCVHNEINPTLIAGFCKIFKNYNLNFTEEFHKLVLCLLNVNSFGKKLSKNVSACQMKLFNNLTSIHRLLEIP
jgi:hypothetical protein